MENTISTTFETLFTTFTSVSDWFWGLVSDFFNTVTTNPLILWSFIFSVTCGVILLFIKLIRKFGFKQKK